MKVKTANGFYLPSFFFMHIQSKESIETLIENNESTFIHEFLHFLQDITLSYCIREALVKNRYFELIIDDTQKRKEIKRPFNNWDDDSILTKKQTKYTWGEPKFFNFDGKITKIEKDYFTIYTTANIYKYKLSLDNGDTYFMGASDLLEYIAHKIENKFYETEHPTFPYKAVDLLFDYYELSDVSTKIKLYFVEFALHNDSPLNQLIQSIEMFLTEQPLIFKSEKLCKELLVNIQWKSKGGFEETISSKTERRLNDFKNSFSNLFQQYHFADIQMWIDDIIIYSRKNFFGKLIFAELYSLSRNEFNEYLTKILNDIGVPLIFNDNSECITLLPMKYDSDIFLQFYVNNTFMEYISTVDKKCPVYQYCNSANYNIIDKHCITNPVIRTKDDNLCPFALLLKSYGLENIKWK